MANIYITIGIIHQKKGIFDMIYMYATMAIYVCYYGNTVVNEITTLC